MKHDASTSFRAMAKEFADEADYLYSHAPGSKTAKKLRDRARTLRRAARRREKGAEAF